MNRLITLSSDFAVQSQGVGAMEATIFGIAPHARVIHLMHGLPEFDLIAAARTMETVRFLPVGIHVCVCDPGVGTSRKGIVLRVQRGDFFIGPDNGIFVPACRLLGGVEEVRVLSNQRYMRLPVSPLFHGRDVFAPAAAHLASGVAISEFGPALHPDELAPAPYHEAIIGGAKIIATVIQINRFGSAHLNILHEAWDGLGLACGQTVQVQIPGQWQVQAKVARTFGEVPQGSAAILRDDYGRVELARNKASFVAQYPMSIGSQLQISW